MAAGVSAKPTPTAKCAVLKRAAVAKKIAARLRCQSKADLKNVAVDPVCLAKVDAAFQKAIAKAEAKPGCLTTGDATSLESTADGFVTNLLNALPPNCFGVNHVCSSNDQCCSNSCAPIVGNNGECD
jgi:hypothetical protein